MKYSGYSGTPLAKKLGFREGLIVRIVNQPDHYFDLFEELPKAIEFSHERRSKKDLIHYFARGAKELERDILLLKNEIVTNGIIWISWPKKSSKIATDITEDTIRNLALENGLVDVKVCAVDEMWSGLKLVIPLKDRKH
jgi:hypothetical protein